MSTDASDMDIDNQSEDGEIKKSPSKDMDFRYGNSSNNEKEWDYRFLLV